ncbi:D-aminoacylase [Thalassotalea sp. 1_MG-2023]|uniref:N-acyl-D-amino-acid deacylase family protein n=1 Tax=Thalassotalea sp. 1_MG-2023 TaxID=3062680 RepID=UPI0026E1F8FB|nr:D-aminoacylase [Thalassotalea sp. 1_MG-2023]MDO6425553.1 D-aminoacylase [Thalassotalea sp. 1_MG-2023]
MYDLIIKNAQVIDGSGAPAQQVDVAICGDKIATVGESQAFSKHVIDAKGLVLSPGFIDVHTHDDLEVVRNPDMLAKVSQGVSTVVVGNCGISASPYQLGVEPPDPINLLGKQGEFNFACLSEYIDYLSSAPPNVNVVALVGHTALRAQVMDDLSRGATDDEIAQMQQLLRRALEQGAKGLSTGLAYKNAKASTEHETQALASVLHDFDALYTTHLRTEFDGIIDALDEAFTLGKKVQSPVVISHLKCAGKQNWGRSKEIIAHVEQAAQQQPIACDCYPYHASSSTLDLNQVTDDFEIFITWSDTEPTMAGQSLAAIAKTWKVSLHDAAKRLMPAGAVYHGMNEQDVEAFLKYDRSMIGSDGLPCDPHPHPRLWGAFPRVLGRYSREKSLFPLATAIHKMTGKSAENFNLHNRGLIKSGYYADLVLFDPKSIIDNADFTAPFAVSSGIKKLWVNGRLTYQQGEGVCPVAQSPRTGQFLKHTYIKRNKS